MCCWFARESQPKIGYPNVVAMTLDQIVEETRHWPPEKVGELAERLGGVLHHSDPEIEAAWRVEISRHIEEIRSGKVQGIPLEESQSRIRKIVGQ
jgi:putative addiction module component (TIGR02574 family)